MRILVSVIALAIALAWPSVGETQSKKSTARGAAATQRNHVQRPKAIANRAHRSNALCRLCLVGLCRLGLPTRTSAKCWCGMGIKCEHCALQARPERSGMHEGFRGTGLLDEGVAAASRSRSNTPVRATHLW